MSNMSYCRFENTSNDLNDCAVTVEEILDGCASDDDNDLNEHEVAGAKRLIKTALEMVLRLASEAELEVGDLDGPFADKKLWDALARAIAANQSEREEREEEENS